MAIVRTGSHSARCCPKVQGVIHADIRALQPDETLRSAGDHMRSHHAGTWPVVQDRTLVGMIECPNPDWTAQRFGHDPNEARVCTIMTGHVTHCFDDDDCAKAIKFMRQNHLSYMPVTDHEDHFLGIVSLDDLLGALAERKAAHPRCH